MKQIIVDDQVTNYFITENGECFNKHSGKFLKGQISNSGYLNYNLTLPTGVKRRLYAHRLVAEAYLENPNLLPQVNHKDGNKLNNSYTNLEWVTASQNQKHSVELGLKSSAHKVYQFDKDLKLIKVFPSIESVADSGYNIAMVSQEMRNSVKNLTLGFYWSDSDLANFITQNNINCGTSRKVYQTDLKGNIVAIFDSLHAAAKAVNGSHSHISECCRGKIKTYKGFQWRYNE